MKYSTKMLFVVVALGTALATPAFAQTPNRQQTDQTGWGSRVHVYAPDHYTPHYGNPDTNPDYQLGGARN